MTIRFKHGVTLACSALLLSAIGSTPAILTPAPAAAQVALCKCKFAKPPWEAFGTKAFCAAKMRPGLTTCEIAFAGFGADPKLVASVVGRDPVEYQQDVLDVLKAFEQYVAGNRAVGFTPSFLSKALLVLMRGAYLRGPQDDKEIEQTKLLDAAIRGFLEKYSAQVTDVFLGKSPPFSTEVADAKLQIGRGTVNVEHAAGTIATIYIPAE
ncbi:hypothetical protein QA635_38925 [Bradyrhizobium brasilense]|uniref:hypothetical protein n=1 Tax=Bradyrhizobium brasilense TaxID=1419277 RepID=UPI0024B0F2A2|nr:hypothetical protein [Bradyrhizobium australafricanum]WFU32388.1 hypothetical protein QA635_38925 [Bradyrhizobium australafricanum]